MLFTQLTQDESARLLGRTPSRLDSLSDVRDALYAAYAYKLAIDAAYGAAFDEPIQLLVDSFVIGQTVSAYLLGPRSVETLMQAVIGGTTNPQLQPVFRLVARDGPSAALDMLMGAIQGQQLIGTTSVPEFESTARAFFGALSSAELQALQARYLPTSAASIAADALVNSDARAALVALSPIALSISPAVAEAVRLEDERSEYTGLSESWVRDRSGLLAAMAATRRSLSAPSGSTVQVVGDEAANYSVTLADGSIRRLEVRPRTRRPGQTGAFFDRNIVFGSDSRDDTLSGTNAERVQDRLYGGAGNDTINGQAGNDYLEGQTGNDTLNGGAGSDTLLGGAGNDTYLFTSGEAKDGDVVADKDGQGSIRFDTSYVLSGGLLLSEGIWQSADKKVRYSLSKKVDGTQDLIIEKLDSKDRIVVRGFTNGNLGINLSDAAVPPPSGLNVLGDMERVIDTTVVSAPGTWQFVRDPAGPNVLLTGAPQPGIDDVLYGLDHTDDRLQGGAGNDALSGFGGDDVIDGGDGNDVLFGQRGRDVLRGGNGNDAIWGSGGGTSHAPAGGTYPALNLPSQVFSQGYGWAIGMWTDAEGNPNYFPVDNSFSPISWTDAGNIIDGGAGDDLIRAGTGDDLVYGGADNDSIVGMQGADTLFGDDGNDSISGDLLYGQPNGVEAGTPGAGGNDYIDGGAGDDQLSGQEGSDEIYGGTGADRLYGDGSAIRDGVEVLPPALHGADYLDGEAGDDYLQGDGGDDTLFGGADNDQLLGDARVSNLSGEHHGNDYLDGEGGNDSLEGGGGSDQLFGGSENDQLRGDSGDRNLAGQLHGDDYLDGEQGNDVLQGDGGADVLIGGEGDDSLRGDGDIADLGAQHHGADELDGGSGIDYLQGDGGDDRLVGGEGGDTLYGDFGTDVPGQDVARGKDILDGGTGEDYLSGGGGDDQLFGGEDNDTLVGDGDNEIVALHGNDLLDGGAGNDLLSGGNGSDTLLGGSGNDSLYGGSASSPGSESNTDADVLDGGEGNDYLDGDNGNDQLSGGTGDDWLLGRNDHDSLTGGAGSDRLDGGSGNDVLSGGEGNDELDGEGGADTLSGDAGDDWLRGGAGDDQLDGGAGVDIVDGQAGDDALVGGEGNDRLFGGDGNDVLTGGQGADYLAGGAGDDTYVISASDLYDAGNLRENIDDREGANTIVLDGMRVDAAGVAAGASYGSVNLQFLQGEIAIQNAFVQAGLVIRNADGTSATLGDLITERYNERVSYSSMESGLSFAGGRLNDSLSALGAGSTLRGGAGNDFLRGGTGGGYTFVFNQGDGLDQVSKDAEQIALGQREANRFAFGTGVSSNSVRLSYDPDNWGITLHYGTQADAIRLGGDLDTLINQGPVDRLTFADGTVMTWQQLLDRGVDLVLPPSWAVSNPVYGTAASDRVQGDELNRRFETGDGADVITFGTGNEIADGGSGNDRFVFSRGAGSDEVLASVSALEANTLQVNGYTIAEAQLIRYQSDLIVRFAGSQDQVAFRGFFRAGSQDKLEIQGQVFSPATVPLTPPDLLVTEGDDVVYLSEGADTLNARGGNDQVFAGAGNDTVMGGAGNDQLYGDAGNDNLQGGDGDDALFGGDGNDLLDTGTSLGGSQTANGEAGNDVLMGGGTLDGGAGNDQITLRGFGTARGGSGDDTLSAQQGSGWLVGGQGADTFLINRGIGSLEITLENWGAREDVLRFGPGIAPSQVRIQAQGPDGVVWIDLLDAGGNTTSDRVRLPGYAFVQDGRLFSRVEFADSASTIWTGEQLRQLAVQPTSGNDFIVGTPNADVLDGLAGRDIVYGEGGNDLLIGGSDDVLYGGQGNDTLEARGPSVQVIGGEGSDTIVVRPGGSVWVTGTDTAPGSIDTLRVDPSIQWADILVRRPATGSRRDSLLLIHVDPVTRRETQVAELNDYFKSGASGGDSVIDRIEFDGGSVVLTRSQILSAIGNGTAGDDRLVGSDAADTLIGRAGNDVLFGMDGADVLVGEAGSDLLEGGAGDDVYRFGLGHGSDQINEVSSTIIPGAGNDRLELGAGITTSNVTFTRDANDDLILEVAGSADEIRVSRYFSQPNGTIETIRFAGGTNWTFADIQSRLSNGAASANSQTGTATANNFVVDHWNDTVTDSTTGDGDTVSASVSFVLPNGVENLTLTGTLNLNATGNGNKNTLRGNSGGNTLDDGGGGDVLIGGQGDDLYIVRHSGRWSSAGYPVVPSPIDSPFAGGAYENANEGVDTLQTERWSEALGDNIENLVQRASTANSISYVSIDPPETTYRYMIGNSLNNVIDVSEASSAITNPFSQVQWSQDRLRTYFIDGGAGADVMISGDTHDIYVVDNLGDRVIERGGIGSIDTIESSISMTLSSEIEHLTLTGSTAISGTGNAGNNTLNGARNSAANVLTGGAGDDRYVIGLGDSVVEAAGGGLDTVQVDQAGSTTVRLTDFVNIENLGLGYAAGDVNLQGNAQDNLLFGSYGANTIEGGDGHDTILGLDTTAYNYANISEQKDVLRGGAGNDRIFSYSGGDLVEGGSGNDEITVVRRANTATAVAIEFGLGDGQDVINAGAASVDLRLKASVSMDQVTFARNGADLIIRLSDGSSMTLRFAFPSETASALRTDLATRLRFDDGSVWQREQFEIALLSSSRRTATVGADLLSGNAGNDVLDGLAGSDSLYGDRGADTLSGSDGDDYLDGGSGDDTLRGGAGGDTLDGAEGADLLEGGAGNDRLYGGAGTDTYRFSRDFGNDEINEAISLRPEYSIIDAGVDTVQFDGSLSVSEISFEAISEGGTPQDLLVRQVGSSHSVRVRYFFSEGGLATVERFVFNDGTVLTADQVRTLASTIRGTDLADTLYSLPGGGQALGLGGNDVLEGNAGNDVLDGGLGSDTMRGRSGNDVYIVDAAGDVVTENTNEGVDRVESSITYTLGANVENLTLTGTAALNGTGNSLSNTLIGNAGNNTLNGAAGADTMQGGAGNDVYIVDNAGDVVTESANEGTDRVESSVSFVLGANVENLTLTGTAAINATGNVANNTLTGNSGNNRLDGGAGADAMTGGAGNDTYVVDNTGDTVTEAASGGTDTIESSVTYTLGTEVENLTLTGTSAINATGNGLANILRGNAAANTLNGGAGNDTMLGGAGDDVYIVDTTGDVVTENANEGVDRIDSSVTFTLGANVEHLTLTGTAAINGTGNAGDNTLTGNSANNTLTGGGGNDRLVGGAGTDTMAGGTGNDTYVVDVAGDVVTENANEGTDTVESSITYSVASLANVENITLTGTAAINATGNAANNLLIGNSANNTLTGAAGNDRLDGGAGTDTMVGGTGNDTYVVDVAGDVVTENANEGTDTVEASITCSVASLANVENITLTGTAAINATGNAANNILIGNAGNNTLTGGGGNDTLSGGAGADILTTTAGNGIFIGGTGNDTLNTGTGNDRIAFARGDGADLVVGSGSNSTDTLDLSGGITRSNVVLFKNGNDLVVEVGSGEQITLRNWYTGSRQVGTLRIIADANWVPGSAATPTSAETINLATIASQFDTARTSNPAIVRWSLGTNSGLTSKMTAPTQSPNTSDSTLRVTDPVQRVLSTADVRWADTRGVETLRAVSESVPNTGSRMPWMRRNLLVDAATPAATPAAAEGSVPAAAPTSAPEPVANTTARLAESWFAASPRHNLALIHRGLIERNWLGETVDADTPENGLPVQADATTASASDLLWIHDQQPAAGIKQTDTHTAPNSIKEAAVRAALAEQAVAAGAADGEIAVCDDPTAMASGKGEDAQMGSPNTIKLGGQVSTNESEIAICEAPKDSALDELMVASPNSIKVAAGRGPALPLVSESTAVTQVSGLLRPAPRFLFEQELPDGGAFMPDAPVEPVFTPLYPVLDRWTVSDSTLDQWQRAIATDGAGDSDTAVIAPDAGLLMVAPPDRGQALTQDPLLADREARWARRGYSMEP
ncbi:calcium-binding protein [Piscinibacterium candidicorallinum]|uniref:Calcium-binding protein n=1 Tax=Piscinibacterium candidicorallinum TaxID=1793872 RepID=A0ABV7GY32_9BURK